MDILKHVATKSFARVVAQFLIASVALALLSAAHFRLHLNIATAALVYVLVVALLALTGGLVPAILASFIATLCLMDLAPPAHSFRVNDPRDVLAIADFLFVSVAMAFLVSSLRKLNEEALSSVDRRLVDAEQRERARIGRDLHDKIGPRVALLTIRCDQLEAALPSATVAARSIINELVKEIDVLSTELHDLSYALHSPKIEQLGLAKTMSAFCGYFAHQQKVEIDFKSHDLRSPPSPDVSLSLFRVLQEALQNSVKHSGAKQFEVQLLEASDAIQLSVHDSGCGFDSETAMKGRGLGLISMHERIKLVNGELSIDSQINRGTTIHARVPFVPGNSSTHAAA